jgi:type I restriction enzyme R subunit
MVQLNKSRADYYERFQRLIDAYNADSENVDLHLHELIAFTSSLNQEDQRHISEQLSEEELAMLDLLTRPNTALSEQEKAEVKKVARSLLETLKREKLVLDWRKKQQAKADVQVTIDQMLDRLPPSYTQEVYLQLCTEVFQHVYESYFGQGKSVYALAS